MLLIRLVEVCGAAEDWRGGGWASSDLVTQIVTEGAGKIAVFELLTCGPEVQKSSRIEVVHDV